MRLRAFDLLTLGYFAAVSLIVTIFHYQVRQWYAYPLLFGVGALVIVGLARAHAGEPGNRWLTLARFTYPLVFSAFVYGSIGNYVLVFRGHFVDAGMNAFESRAFGTHPNIAIGAIVSRPVTEALYACYFGFYLFFLVPPLVLFRAGRYADIERYVFALAAALYVCYLGFLAVPLAGPGTSLAGQFSPAVLAGYVIVPLQKYIQAKGDPIGACFPSAHVAGCWTAMLAIRDLFGRRVFWLLAPGAAGLTVAVVYTRYHYLSDALAGIAVAVVVFALVRRYAWERMVTGGGPENAGTETNVRDLPSGVVAHLN